MHAQPAQPAQPATELAVIAHPAIDLSTIWTVGSAQTERDLLNLWYRLREQWLHIQESDATRRAYSTATLMWLDWLADRDVQPWAATSAHVRAWQDWLTASGNAPSTVNARLSATSSWYQFVINEVHIVNGIERSAFFDANHNTRANPFKVGNLKRPKVTQYGKAAPLHNQTVQKLIEYLKSNKGTLTGSRNYALVFTHLLTAARGSEIVRLRWRDIRPNREHEGQYVFDWKGKGDKEKKKTFPAPAYALIVAHLKIAGRWLPGHPDHIGDDDYIFVPLVTHGLANLRNVEALDAENAPHLSPKSAQRILQTSLRAAGVENWANYRVHDLRHTLAHAHYKENHDLEALRDLLNHESIATTGIYIRNMQEPVDDYTQGVMRQMGLL